MPLDDLPDTFQRLLVYLLIDTSGSMAGAPIAAVNEGLQMFERTLRRDPQCLETAHACVISFNHTTAVEAALRDAESFRAPTLSAGGSTVLSKGLEAVARQIATDWKPKSVDHPGDWKPLLFVLTDGHPNPGDPWKAARDKLMARRGGRPSMIVSIGCGPDINMEFLRELSPEAAYYFADLNDAKIRALFEWIAASTVMASRPQSHVAGRSSRPADFLPAPPPNLFDLAP